MTQVDRGARLEDIRRRMRLISLAMIPVEIAAVVGLYFFAPLPEVLAVVALFLMGGVAAVATDRRIGAISARDVLMSANELASSRPLGPRRAKLFLWAMLGFYLCFAVIGSLIGDQVNAGQTGAVVGGVVGFIVSYGLLIISLRFYKRRKLRTATPD